VVVREPRKAPAVEEDGQQAVTALAVMIREWWDDRCRSADAVRASDQSRGDPGVISAELVTT
jgi:hypothetical protein